LNEFLKRINKKKKYKIMGNKNQNSQGDFPDNFNGK
jgi:hypothetical protein